MAEEKKDYVFNGRSFDGFDKDGNRKNFVAGDTVALTDAQYEAFKDQFEAPEAPKKEAPKPSAGPAASTAKVS